MASRFANKTSVAPEKTRAEIESVLRKYGAKEFGFMIGADCARILFSTKTRKIAFTLPLLTSERIQSKRDQLIRSRWRVLLLAIKAKLEAVEVGLATFEQEFMAYVVNPATGRTVGEELIPLIGQAYDNPDHKGALRLPGLPAPE